MWMGSEAYAALLRHLGKEPWRKSHLGKRLALTNFTCTSQHPAISTRASLTPWHPQLEFRGHSGVIVLPPSIHPSGKPYVWSAGVNLWRICRYHHFTQAIVDAIVEKQTALRDDNSVNSYKKPEVITTTLPVGFQVAPSTTQFLSGAEADHSNWNRKAVSRSRLWIFVDGKFPNRLPNHCCWQAANH